MFLDFEHQFVDDTVHILEHTFSGDVLVDLFGILGI